MGKTLLHNILRFLALIVLQVIFFKNIGYYNLAAPFPYILFIFYLPIGLPNFLLYVIGCVTGLTIDIFYDSIGIHTAACITLCAYRIFFHQITIEIDLKKSFYTPNLSTMGFKWFISYIFFGTLLHHLILLMLEVFSFRDIHITLLSTLMSSIFTFLLILLISLLFYKRKSRLID